ncbi:MAG: hypothetical protein NT015_15930 [Alphaproteobacteria bacterium]|nr:hypothetical protein [Alphaproteobacteria bacterium]
MGALRPGTILFWEAARIPFNALLVMFAAVAFAPLFARFSEGNAWSYVWTWEFIATFAAANVVYCVIHPLDRLLQRSRVRGKEMAARVAIWSGLALISVAAIVRVASGFVSMALF